MDKYNRKKQDSTTRHTSHNPAFKLLFLYLNIRYRSFSVVVFVFAFPFLVLCWYLVSKPVCKGLAAYQVPLKACSLAASLPAYRQFQAPICKSKSAVLLEALALSTRSHWLLFPGILKFLGGDDSLNLIKNWTLNLTCGYWFCCSAKWTYLGVGGDFTSWLKAGEEKGELSAEHFACWPSLIPFSALFPGSVAKTTIYEVIILNKI